jgi:cytochrome c oxidase assembly protein subunit 15
MSRSSFSRLSLFVTLFGLCVVMLGAYVRLSDAGLGCPDWPGCYGQLVAPSSAEAVDAANAGHNRPLDTAKAWKEMVHRYFAGTLGLLILAIAVAAWRRRHRDPEQLLAVPLILLALVIFQALLGMWTVTLQVKPAIVTAHLLGGVLTVSLLWWLTLRQAGWGASSPPGEQRRVRPWVWLGIILLLLQISLGGWTSTNYAALGCTEFPTCYGGQWWPATDFSEAFVLWRGLGINYEFGVLDSAARTAIHLTHRIGALLVLLYLGGLAWRLLRSPPGGGWRGLGIALVLTLALQISLGISNVLGGLPLPVAVAHNGGAVVLMLVLLTLLHRVSPRSQRSLALPGQRAAMEEKGS